MESQICVTVPTVRNPEVIKSYVENARKHGFDTENLHFLLVTEDFLDINSLENMLDEIGVSGDVFAGKTRESWFENKGLSQFKHLIPDASHAETSFGLLWMLAHEEFEYGIFIDDDTQPHPNFDFFNHHIKNLESTQIVEEVSSDKKWVNVLYQNAENHGLYPRGYPYSAMDETISIDTKRTGDVVANQGLWTNIPDLDAVRILMDGDLKGQAKTRTSTEDFHDDFVVAENNYLTVSSMNLSFKREIIPAFYQFPMDDNEWEIGRFDDIWSGLTLKKAADMLGKQVMNGYPLCIHNKAERSTFSDLNNEVPGLELNEHFWEALNSAPDQADNYYEAYELMIQSLRRFDFSEYENSGFIEVVISKMEDWIDICQQLSS